MRPPLPPRLLGMETRRVREWNREGSRYLALLGLVEDSPTATVWRDCTGGIPTDPALPDAHAAAEAWLDGDRAFLTETLLPELSAGSLTPTRVYINGVFTVGGATPIEPTFYERMWEGIGG